MHKLAECSNPTYLEAHGFTSFLRMRRSGSRDDAVPDDHQEHRPDDRRAAQRAATRARSACSASTTRRRSWSRPATTLQKALNETIEATIEAKAFGPKVHFANPFKKINPQGKKSQTPNQKKLAEAAAICNYTEECNPFDRKLEAEKANKTTYTAEEWAAIETEINTKWEKEESGGKFLPGDIHPTTAGDELFAKLLNGALKKAVALSVS